MTPLRGSLFFAFFVVVCSASSPEDYLDRFKSMMQGIRELTEMHPMMLAQASEAKDMMTAGGSREELEEEKAPGTGSASQENPDKTEDDDDEDSKEDSDEYDDGLELTPVRGLSALFGLHDVFARSKPWWTGPNVCEEREEKEEKSPEAGAFGDFISFGSAQFSNCVNSPEKYTCRTMMRRNGVSKTTVVTYQCCHGFRRTRESSNCTKVETKPVLEIAEDLGGERFGDLVKSAGLEKELSGKVTVFLPPDSAMNKHRAMDSLNSVDPILTNEVPNGGNEPTIDQKSFVQGHVVDGLYQISDLSDEQVLTTLANTTLRVNFLRGRGGVTVNCVRLNQTDKLSENGVVHALESVLEPVTRNLAQVLSDDKLSKFKQLLEENGLWEMMSGDKPLTVFAVNNEGVEEISSRHKMCMKNILAHHILPHTLCSAMGDSGERLATLDLAQGWLPFGTKDGEMTIGNGTKVLEKDALATNGLVHIAQGFVIPSGGRTVSELLDQTEHEEWLSLVKKSGLLDEIESTENMTMFVPTDEAVKEAELGELTEEELKDLVRYHVGSEQDDETVTTLLPGQNLTISTEKSSFPGLVTGRWSMTVQCAPIRRVGGRVCNGLLHEIGSVLRAPKQSVFEYVQSAEGLEKLRNLLKGTKLEEELKSGLGYPVTFLAPVDSAFDALPKERLEELEKDKEAADRLLRSHIIKEAICCGNAVHGSWPFVYTAPTLGGRAAEVSRRGQNPTFGSLPVTDCDHITTNGIVHLVEGLRLEGRRQPERELILRRPNSEIILAGI